MTRPAQHWAGCEGDAWYADELGTYCAMCGVRLSNAGSQRATIGLTDNEDRVSTCDAPGPLDANKERRNA